MAVISILAWLCLALSAIGCAYMLAAAATVFRFFRAERPAHRSNTAVTILKPLHGAEPCLTGNLETFLSQDHGGPIQLVCGVRCSDDPAVAVVDHLARRHLDARIDLIVDSAQHGSNAKISNLINMMPKVTHDFLVLSDSDMAVAPDYLSQLLSAFDRPRVGAVTCLYRGRGDAGFWSRLGAAGLSYQFLPNATFATALGQIGDACMGSTIALRRPTLDAIGGFTRFADVLADDHAIGKAVRKQGLDVVIPPMLLTHGSDETSFGALWRHELRWAATVRGLTPAWAYAGSLITFPLPLAIIGAFFHPAAGIALALVALTIRIVAAGVVDTVAGTSTASKWLLPARDFLSLAIFIASYAVRSVDWRGSRLTMGSDGRIAPGTESQGR